MATHVSGQWPLELHHSSPRDRLILEIDAVVDELGELVSWSFTARQELARGGALVLGELSPSGAVALRHTFDNKVQLHGELRVHPGFEATVISADVRFGFGHVAPQFFQGALLDVPKSPPRPPAPEPDPDPEADPDPDLDADPGPDLDADAELDPGSDLDPLDEPCRQPTAASPCAGGLPEPWPPPGLPASARRGSLAREEGDLFPYTYVHGWAEPSAGELALGFAFYPHPLEAAPSGALVQELAALHRSGDPAARDRMQELAARYLDGPLVDDPRFARYPQAHALLAGAGRHTPAQRRAAIFACLELPADAAGAALRCPEHVAAVAELWQRYFAALMAPRRCGAGPQRPERIARLLVVEHALGQLVERTGEALDGAALRALAEAALVLPAGLFPLPPTDRSSPPVTSPPLISPPAAESAGGVAPYALGQLLVVRYRLRGYELGELAFVESLRAGERRESTRRQRERTVERTERTRHDEAAQQQDEVTATTSLRREVLGTLADTIATTTYHDFGTSYGPPTTATLNGSWSVEHKPAGPPGQEELTGFARQVLGQALHRLAHRVAEGRGASALRDCEERVTSFVDNSQGAHHRRAVYRWLDEVYSARVLDCGARLLVEIVVPAPAARLIRETRAPRALGAPLGASLGAEAAPPIAPVALGIESFEDLGRHNFAALLARYPGESLELPPPPRRTVSVALQSGEARAVELPEGYVATAATLAYAASGALRGVIGGQAFQLQASGAGVERLALAGQEEGSLQVVVQLEAPASPPGPDAPPRSAPLLSLEVTAVPSARAMDGWRLRLYQALIRSYAAQCQAWQRARHAEAEAGASRPRWSPRAVERRELQRGALAQLLAHQHALAGDLGDQLAGAPGAARPDLGHPLPPPQTLRFLQEVFEWREMTYAFLGDHPDGAPGELSGSRTSGPAALAERLGGDERFHDFLGAAYARLLVPVTVAHAPALLRFLSSGEVPPLRDRSAAVYERDVALLHALRRAIDERAGSASPRVVRELPPLRVPTRQAVLTDGDVPSLGLGAAGASP